MTREEYLAAVNQFMYQGEVLGEAIFNCAVSLEADPIRKYKWGTVLQLESETKTRLRPFMTQLGLSIAQNDQAGTVAAFAETYASKSWRQHMEEAVAVTSFYLDKFREIEAAAPDSERAVAHSMVVHEAALKRFAELELAGDEKNSLNDVIAQLKYPLATPGGSEDRNLEIVMRIYRAIAEGDIETRKGLVTDDFVLHFFGSEQIPWAGEWRGKDGLGDFLNRIAEAIDFEEFATDEFLLDGDNVVVLGHERCRVRATGRVAQVRWAHLFTLRGGMVCRHHEYTDTAAWEAAFAGKG
ncbi:MAG TPA: nuclear transport factor 2 family protein [Candidatus Binataceae bacterium]|nr:nuclear transport factor 2 family protein [Candidatus Binataceae bacterium]